MWEDPGSCNFGLHGQAADHPLRLGHSAHRISRPLARFNADYRGGVTCLMDTQLPEPPSVVGLHVSIRGGEGRQGHSRRTARPPSHGTGPVGWVSPASFNRGLWARLLR